MIIPAGLGYEPKFLQVDIISNQRIRIMWIPDSGGMEVLLCERSPHPQGEGVLSF
jgi:hypothetical protein